MRYSVTSLVLVTIVPIFNASPAWAQAGDWWAHVTHLADDSMRGRGTGTAEHRRAAEYVSAAFQRAGLRPGGTQGFMQPVRFRERRIVEGRSSLSLVRGGVAKPLVLGDEATINMRADLAPSAEAPLVFVGYGLTVPEISHDDLAGLDLRGKVAVVLAGGPSALSGPLLAHHQSVRWSALRRAGAIGLVTIPNPRASDIPWARSALARFIPQMSIADSALDETAGQRIAVTVNPARAERLFAGSPHSFRDLLSLADSGKALPRFALPVTLRATVAFESRELVSDNVVGILPGSDPVLRDEYVVLSAHLDHVGVSRPINGDSIYNGAMDNAAGTATLIETALAAARQNGKFRRSVIFLAVTAEEKGLLGSKYFAARPTVPRGSIVANVNTDMFLPLFPMRGVIANGIEESDLANDLNSVAERRGIRAYVDPEPERNAFVRSDQYSFIRQGIPALSLKNGFERGSPEHEIVRRFRSERYHAPSDDLTQQVDLGAAEAFNRLVLDLVGSIANRADRPQWNADSFFRRFAVPAAAN